MFSNIGKKIKTWAVIVCWVGIIGAIISGIVILCYGFGIFLGLAEMVVGSLFAWIGCFLLYGYGELIDKVADIERNTCGAAVPNGMGGRVPMGQPFSAPQSESVGCAYCVHCGNPLNENDAFCKNCGQKR